MKNYMNLMMNVKLSIILVLIFPVFFANVYGHQIDSIEGNRIQIAWKNSPAISGESNAIEVYVSKLDPEKEIDEQEFDASKGITGLKKTLKIELVYKGQKLILPLTPDTTISGKYSSVVTPTFSGYSQLNFIGSIDEKAVNFALHPKKVEEKSVTEFPPIENLNVEKEDFQQEINDLREEIHKLEENVKEIENTKTEQKDDYSFIAMVLGVVGIIIGSIALIKKR